jgi:hypothetical protein
LNFRDGIALKHVTTLKAKTMRNLPTSVKPPYYFSKITGKKIPSAIIRLH